MLRSTVISMPHNNVATYYSDLYAFEATLHLTANFIVAPYYGDIYAFEDTLHLTVNVIIAPYYGDFASYSKFYTSQQYRTLQ